MGTIAEKLTYLNTTKIKLRDSLNKFGSSILSTDTFRSYDTKLNDIYDKLPKVTATGQGFTISNVQNGLLDDFKMNGVDLQQNTTTGKNLFDKDNEIVGYVYNSSGDLVSSSNWNTNNEFKKISNNKISLSCKTTYPISFLLIEFDSNKTFIQRQQSTTTSYTFTLNNNTEYLRFCYLNNVGTHDIQIEEGSISTDYEPYTGGIPSPNPDYPQEIKVVEGRQVITDKGKNLFDVSQTPHSNSMTSAGVTLNINDDGTISTSGTNTETYRNIRYDIQLPAGEYIISGCPAGGSKNGYSLLVQLTEETSSQVFDTGNGATFSLQETTTVKFYPVRVGSDTANFNGLIFKPMIRLSNISNDTYEPYYNPVSYNIDLNLENIYLAKMPNTDYKNRIYKNNGNWYFEKSVEKYLLDGTRNWRKYTSGNYTVFYIENNGATTGSSSSNPVLSDKFKSKFEIGNDNIFLSSSGNRILISTTIADSLEDWNAWLSIYNVIVYYALATPVTTQITNTTLINQLEVISVHTGTNIITISNDNNIIPEIEITRLKELEKLA